MVEDRAERRAEALLVPDAVDEVPEAVPTLPDEVPVPEEEEDDEEAPKLSCATVPPVGEVTAQVGMVRPALTVRMRQEKRDVRHEWH